MACNWKKTYIVNCVCSFYLCIHYSLDWLSFYLRARFRGESGRTFIFWWEQSLIQNRPVPRSLPLSERLFLSVHQTGSLALCLCPSARLSATVSPSVSVCLSFSVFSSLSRSQPTCLCLSFTLPSDAFSLFCISKNMSILRGRIMKMLFMSEHYVHPWRCPEQQENSLIS